MPERGWRAALGSPAVALFCLAFAAYAYFYQAGGWNQNSRFDLTRAIVERGTLRIDAYHRNTGDKSQRDGHYYCDKAPGQPLLAVPAYALVHAWAGGERPSPAFLAASAYAATVWSVALPAALAVVFLARLLGELGLGACWRCALAAGYGLATLAFPYATVMYGHQLMAALLVIGFALLVRERRRVREGGAASRVRVALAGLALGGAVAVEYPAALAVVALSAYAAAFLRPWPRLAWFAAGGAVAALALAGYHAAAFGGPLTLPYEFSTQKHRHMGVFMGLGAPAPAALWGITLSSYRGLFYSAPWLLAAAPGAALFARVRRARAELLVCAGAALLFVWLNASLVDWQGGWAMGPRYLVPAIPFAVVLVAGCVLGWPGGPRWVARVGAAALALLVAVSAAAMLVGTAVKPEVPVWVDRPFSDYLVPAFAAGRLGVSTQSIDSASAPSDGPSKAWNLGHLLGLDGLASLVPLALVLAAGTAWLGWTLRRRR
jgi:hypothetical protein